VYNGLEQVTSRDSSLIGFNIEEIVDFMPRLGVMAGFAATLVIEPSNADHPETHPDGWGSYRRYVASVPDPKILVVDAAEISFKRAVKNKYGKKAKW
jgi:hypothetical protein